ncbi:hypothetical protein KUTeg_000138 [Tegillarca granosa]|uniref:Uncharacterized protein n=1 Tax=Tegillarca granosa TaxID=220873 RepID=A0ABQ9FWN6_TEGGR|nr:hypothetical protein KUTeg_000138 [Tegillarca granosa]
MLKSHPSQNKGKEDYEYDSDPFDLLNDKEKIDMSSQEKMRAKKKNMFWIRNQPAQKLGLVEAPEQPLLEEEWKHAKEKSNKREDSVLLSCTHVFHKSYWRGYVVRCWYKKLRESVPPKDPKLRQKFYEEKLSSITDRIIKSCDFDVNNFLYEIDQNLERSQDIFKTFDAAFHHIDDDEWEEIQLKAVKRGNLECPICLAQLGSKTYVDKILMASDKRGNLRILENDTSLSFPIPKARKASYKNEFRARRRRAGESLSDFAYSLRRLGNLAYPSQPYLQKEELIVDRFIESFRETDPELAKHVQFCHPETMEEAIASAEDFDSFTKASVSVSKPKIDNKNVLQSVSVNSHSEEENNLSELLEKVLEDKKEDREYVKKLIEVIENLNTRQSSETSNSNMDVLDLTVPKVAVQSLDRDVRLEWPQEGMCCHVSACASHELFKTLRAYMKHWRKAHVQFATLYQCRPTLPPRLPTKEQKIKAQERRRKEAQPTTTELDSLLQCMDDLEDYNLDL